jgi:hypothetical protein
MSDRDTELYRRYARLWTWLTVIGLVVVGLLLMFMGQMVHLSKEWDALLKSIGGSVLASAIVFLLVSVLLEPRREEAQAKDISRYSIEVANKRFQERFEISLPIATFEASAMPKRDFREAFAALLSTSTRYDCKAGTVSFTTFRLFTLQSHIGIRRLDEIRLCLIDPRETVPLRAHAENQLGQRQESLSGDAIEREMARLREEIFISIIALFDMRDSVSTSMYLYRDLPFFRCEMFDGGMFLTYYLGKASYPETLQFKAATRPYVAYSTNLELTRRFSSKMIAFSSVGPAADLVDTEDKLQGLLQNLGYSTDCGQLRAKREELFSRLRQDLERGGISPSDLF